MRAWPSSLRLRLTLWYAIVLAIPLFAFAVVCYVVFARALLDRTDRFIGDALTAFSRELVVERRMTSTVERAIQTTLDEVRFHDLSIAILDTSRRVVAATAFPDDDGGADQRPSSQVEEQVVAALRVHDISTPLRVSVSTRRGAFRVIARPLTLRGQHFGVAGTYTLSDIEGVLARIRQIFMIAIPLLVLVAATGGYFLAKRSLAPVSAMTARAAAVSATNLHERLPVGGGDELVGLAQVVNDLLDRLEGSFEQQRRFMADASHELRTPTAILRTEADLTLSREHRAEPEYRESMTIMQDATRRLTRIVDDLFLLARADSGHLVPQHQALYLEDVVHDATTSVRRVADRRGVTVALGQVFEAPFNGDADLLGRLFLNLLDNAIKHSREGGIVDVTMTRRNDLYEFRVVDAGAGIPHALHERVFERFFRADPVRTRTESVEQSATSGAGLGLAIARCIAEMHGGLLELAESRPGRTEFRITLPAA